MQSDDQIEDTFKHKLSPELLAVLQAKTPHADRLQVHAWQPSLLGRLVGMLAGKPQAR